MHAANSIKPVQARNRSVPRSCCLVWMAIVLMVLFGLLAGSNLGFASEASITEYQVKAIFLFNFAKYVDWPASAFQDTNAPITIGVMGEDRFDDNLRHTVAGKTVNGRTFVIRNITADDPPDGCHILFISDSEKMHLIGILGKTRALPVLTVGETGQFMNMGGVINFVKKEGKIRLEINLEAARHAKLQISSGLLNVADVVKGKTN